MKIDRIYFCVLALASLSAFALAARAAADGAPAASEATAASNAPAGDAEAGRRVFNRNCRSCHQVEAGAGSQLGPNLAGLVGRAAAADREFDYSPALQAAAGAGAVWDATALERFLAAPTKMFPGTTMPMAVGDATQRRDLVAYLATLSP